MELRKIERCQWSGLKNPKLVFAGLQELEKNNFLKVVEFKNVNGGRPSEKVLINPFILRNGIEKYISGDF
jgi:hypothetical protein